MSNFEYNKIGQYGNEVKDYIIANNGVLKAIDGKEYTIETDKKSFFGRKDGFKDRVESNKFVLLQTELSADKGKTNQFEIKSDGYPPGTKNPDGKIRDSKYETLGWKQIEKKTFSSKSITISTEQQEKISLKIFKYVLGNKTQAWQSFDDMFNSPNSEVKKIFPDLPLLSDWYAHFTLQFNEIKDKTNLPNNKFDVYEYDGEGSFMDYISDLVTKEMSLYSKKDSWNPADIWLINKSAAKVHIKRFNEIAKKLKDGEYIEEPGKPFGFQSIQDLNFVLKEAFRANEIVGISLKKSDGKNLNYELFNLAMNTQDDSKNLPNVAYDKIQLSCAYNKSTGTFTSKTSYVFVNDNKKSSYKLAYKSNTGKNLGNITYEFLPTSNASAFLGKVPKDRLKDFLKDNIQKFFPVGQNNQPLLNKSIMMTRNSKDKKSFGNPFVTEMAQSVILPTEWNPSVRKFYEDKVKVIQQQFGQSDITGLGDYVKNLEKSYKKGGLSIKNSSMIQMVEFTYQMAMLKKNKKLQTFLTKCFYFAQKRGEIYNFGPFGKLS